jgi:CrcB protein
MSGGISLAIVVAMNHPTLMQVAAVGAAGFFGAVSRYLLGHYAPQWFDTKFPIGTLLVNISACFLIGAAVTYFDNHGHKMPDWLLPAVTVGFIGTYSTFSTYLMEVHKSFTVGNVLVGVVYHFFIILTGLVAVYHGVVCSRGIFPPG